MQDMVENRRRMRFREKLRIAWQVARENGARWSALFGVYYLASSVAHKASGGMTRIRERRGTPGLNSIALNRRIWDAWDWNAAGSEWTVSDSWYGGCVEQVLKRHVPCGSTVLEIGPGGGRWTVPLVGIAGRYLGVDVSSAAIDFCRQRFRHAGNAEFAVGSGTDLSGIADSSVDCIWTFDVFVHINAVDVARYLAEFVRVLRPGGIAVIHHGSVGGSLGGWRSDLTGPGMRDLIREHGLELTELIADWEHEGEVHRLSGYGDVISVIRLPPSGGGQPLSDPDAARC